MPIANCFAKNKQVTQSQIYEMVTLWADQVGVDVKDICLTFIPDCIQAGQQYEILVNLYLPSLWSQANE